MVTLQLTEDQIYALSLAVSRARDVLPELCAEAHRVADAEMLEFYKFAVQQLNSLPECLLTE